MSDFVKGGLINNTPIKACCVYHKCKICQGNSMPEQISGPGRIVLVTDNNTENNRMHAILARTFSFHACPLSAIDTIDMKKFPFVIVDINLSDRQSLKIISPFVERANKEGVSVLFVLKEHCRRDIVQIYALGGKDFVTQPVTAKKIQPFLAVHIRNTSEKSWDSLAPTQVLALKHSLNSFNQMIANAVNGEPLDTRDLEKSSQFIIKATTNDNLVNWVSTLQNHHDRSFSHSLTVCGYLVAFAHELGIKDNDLQKIALAGLLHDIGKCTIPRAILNKPARLSSAEFELMRKHPENGARILRDTRQQWDRDILDATLHHHENMDGSGYPDNLQGAQISNMTLLLTIADIFSALTEKRSYKKAILPQEAYDIMLGMKGKFDEGLLKAFKPIALMSASGAAA